MAQKPQNTSSGKTGSFDKGLTTDVDGFHKQPNQWVQARNAVNNTDMGDVGELSNEQSNYLCAAAPYTIIGRIHITADEWAIFSTDDSNSEIGVFKEDSCSYETVVNAQCLNFNRENLIKGVGRATYDCGRKLYWDDGVNPSMVLDIEDVPWIQDCEVVEGCNICEDTTELDCDKIRLAPLIDDLSFRVERGQGSGQLLNGSYYVVGAYLIDGVKVTDYSLPSNIQPIFRHQNAASSLDIFIEEADQEFDEFELIIVQFANFNTVARKLGIYSTRQQKITLDTIDERLPTIDPGSVLINNPIVDKSDAMFRNGPYMIRTGPTNKFDFNYQPLANQITSEWISVEYDSEYYRDGGSNTGYMRDEVYSYFVRWVYNTGDKSKSYHIPGRAPSGNDTAPVGLPDDVIPGELAIQWNIYNTATVNTVSPLLGNVLDDGGVIVGVGDMAFWESTEIYDDDKPQIWNASFDPIWGSSDPAHDLCGRKIRHHKFPDNATDPSADMVTNHYHPNDGTRIRIMGVKFDNIKLPLDNEGNPITNIISYEILRGSREGNKTVVAKGMVNNLRTYITVDNLNEADTTEYLYPNYPYNPTATVPLPWSVSTTYPNLVCDHFLSSRHSNYKGPGLFTTGAQGLDQFNAYLEDEAPLGYEPLFFPEQTNIKKDLLTFHSPETNFRDPFLSAKEIKIYGELHGTMIGSHAFPKDHPRHKFITNTSFLVSAIIGIGYAMVSTEGSKKVNHTAPRVDYGGTYTQVGVSSGTTGLFGPSAGAAGAMVAANAAAVAANKVVNNVLNHSVLTMLQSIGGWDPNIARDAALTTAGTLAGSTAGIGGEDTYSREVSPWASTPDFIRLIQGIPAFLTYWGEGVDKMLAIIYAFSPYRQYAIQQISHCFYDHFARPDIGQLRREIKYQSYLNPEIQDFARDYKINNIFRSRTVALKLGTDLVLPYKQIDDTQALFSDVWDRFADYPGSAFGGGVNPWDRDEFINAQFDRPASSHYVAMKQGLDNQYGQIANIVQVPVSTDQHSILNPLTEEQYEVSTSPVLFNGDVYIGRYTEKNTMFFFYDWLKGQPDGSEYDYKLRKMVTHPRFWMDTDPFDVGEFMRSIGSIFDNNSSAPSNFDPFMLDPGSSSATPICECGTYTDCFLPQSNLEEICLKEEECYQLELYIDFLESCACFRDTSDCEGLSPFDFTDPLNLLAADYDPTTWVPSASGGPSGGCWGEHHPYNNITGDNGAGCTDCPDWNNPGDYIDDGSKKWGRKIKRVKRKLKRCKKKLNKMEDKLYDIYLDGLDGDQEGFVDDLFDGIITPSDKFAFDMKEPGKFQFTVKAAFMYLFNSGVRDFFVESEINVDLRDWGDITYERHYDYIEYTNLRDLFSTDHIKVGNFMKYDYSLSIGKLFNNYVSWGAVQDVNYDPLIAETCFVYRPNRLMYSLPQAEQNKKDNWRVFLPLNFKDFTSKTTSIKPIGKNGAMIFFENESPVQFAGVDTLKTDGGTKITIGDGGLFSQPLQNLVNAEYPHEYGSCQNRLAISNTPAGLFYMSQNQGKIFMVSQGLKEISNLGLKWWFTRYLPYRLTDNAAAFLDPITGDQRPFDLEDNPVAGIGCQTIFDNENQIMFFCKKDWFIRTDIPDDVVYVSGTTFLVNGSLRVELGDPAYFSPASWTASFDVKNQQWIGFHDWHPDLVIPSKNTFMTTKDNGVWVHADNCKSYCNFYGIDYPFEVEFSLNTVGQVTTLRNVMYLMEAYTSPNDNCNDRFHVLDFNFDEAVVYNSEQVSGLLRLNLQPKNDPLNIVNFPQVNATNIDILYAKEEQKYRFNQFWDITDDRGEFTNVERTIWNTEENGYIKNLNVNNLDYDKFALERKKFRHYKNTVLLRRRVSGNKNIIVAVASQMTLNSPR
jgi:hypothetical protein